MKEKLIKNLKELLPYIIILIVVILIKAYICTPIKVNGPSMNNTLKDKDIMILNKISYRFNDIKRFDIVVIHTDDEYIIKRVIGLPGETIEYKDDTLYINGKKIKENFTHKKTLDIKKIKVPKNKYYVLGDNRPNSTDSRIIGSISKKDIKGKTSLTIFPFSRFGNKK